jgi:hypothetical protein
VRDASTLDARPADEDHARCLDARLLSSRLLDDDLRSGELAELEVHLATCSGCGGLAAAMVELSELLRATPLVRRR